MKLSIVWYNHSKKESLRHSWTIIKKTNKETTVIPLATTKFTIEKSSFDKVKNETSFL